MNSNLPQRFIRHVRVFCLLFLLLVFPSLVYADNILYHFNPAQLEMTEASLPLSDEEGFTLDPQSIWDPIRRFSDNPMSPNSESTGYQGPEFFGAFSIESDPPSNLGRARISRERLEIRAPYVPLSSGRATLFFAFEIPATLMSDAINVAFRVESPINELSQNRSLRLAVEIEDKWFITTEGPDWPTNIREGEFQNLSAYTWTPYSPKENLSPPTEAGASLPGAPITRMGILMEGAWQSDGVVEQEKAAHDDAPRFIHLIVYEVKVSS